MLRPYRHGEIKMPDFSFIQITDHHLLESEEAEREGFVPGHALRMVMRHIAENTADKADFVISTGDRAAHGSRV